MRKETTMREDLVLADIAQRLRGAGLPWRPQPGDWCALVGAAHIAGNEAGIWLVIDTETSGWLTVVDGAARWAARRIVAAEALWLPTIGQMKGSLRANGYAVTTTEGIDLPNAAPPTTGNQRPAWAASLMGVPTPAPTPNTSSPLARHHCRASRPGQLPIEAFGMTEAEAVAQVILLSLAQQVR
jgi:hypothetical protein